MTEEIVATTWIRLIPAPPLLAALILAVGIGLLRRSPTPRVAAITTCASVAAALLFSVLAFAELLGDGAADAIEDRIGSWIGVGVGPTALVVEASLRFDPLAAVFCLLVSGVGLLALVYGIAELRADRRDDQGEARFYAFAAWAIAAMLLVVLADDAFLLLAAWSMLGVATWWLLGFWYGDGARARPAMLAFVVGRIGDAALLAAFAVAFRVTALSGTATTALHGLRDAREPIANALMTWPELLGGGGLAVSELIGGLLLVAIATKAAQLPLTGWLSGSVAAPTPALILVHTVLTVAAPVYLGARLGFVLADAPTAASLAAWLGGATALVCAVVACAQVDVYRLLAWSTASQLGYVIVALAVAAPTAAVFHVVAHAFHKGLLFMAMGVAVASVGGERDIWRMGNLGSRLWRTRIDTWVAVLSIGGVLPFTIGFFSLEQVVVAVGSTRVVSGQGVLAWVVLLAVSATAFGVVRLIYVTLYGDTHVPSRIRWEEIEDPGPAMLWPMGILAALMILGALIGMPQNWADLLFSDVENANSLLHFLGPTLDAAPAAQADAGFEWSLAWRAVAMASLGALPAVWLYLYRLTWVDELSRRLGWLHRRLLAGLDLEPALRIALTRPVLFLAERVLSRRVEAALFEAAPLRGGASLLQGIASGWVRRLQSGSALQYVGTTVLGGLLVIAYLLIAGRG